MDGTGSGTGNNRASCTFSKLPIPYQYQIWLFLHPIELIRVITVNQLWRQHIRTQPPPKQQKSHEKKGSPAPFAAATGVLSRIDSFSITSCVSLFPKYSQLPGLPRPVLAGIHPLLRCFTGVRVLDVTQPWLMSDDEAHDEHAPLEEPRPVAIPFLPLISHIARMPHLTTLIWDDDTANYKVTVSKTPDGSRHTAAQYEYWMSHLPPSLTHLEMRVYPKWWRKGMYQNIVAKWPQLTTLKLTFRDYTNNGPYNGKLSHPATLDTLTYRHGATLTALELSDAELTVPEWGMLARCHGLTQLHLPDTKLYGIQQAVQTNEEPNMHGLSSLGVLTMPCVNGLDKCDLSLHGRMIVWLWRSIPSSVHTLNMSSVELRVSGLSSLLSLSPRLFLPKVHSLWFYPCHAQDVPLDLVVDLVGTMCQGPNLTYFTLARHDLHNESTFTIKLNTAQVVRLLNLCPNLRNIDWKSKQPTPTETTNNHQQQLQHQQQTNKHTLTTTTTTITATPGTTSSCSPSVPACPSVVDDDNDVSSLVSLLPIHSLSTVTSLNLVCERVGVALNGFASLTRLTLESDDMYDDNLQALIKGLPTLKHLDMQADKLTSQGIHAFTTLSNLTSLCLTRLSNGIDDHMWEPLAHCTSLTSVTLDWPRSPRLPRPLVTCSGLSRFCSLAAVSFLAAWRVRASTHALTFVPYPSLSLSMPYPNDLLYKGTRPQAERAATLIQQLERFPINTIRFHR